MNINNGSFGSFTGFLRTLCVNCTPWSSDLWSSLHLTSWWDELLILNLSYLRCCCFSWKCLYDMTSWNISVDSVSNCLWMFSSAQPLTNWSLSMLPKFHTSEKRGGSLQKKLCFHWSWSNCCQTSVKFVQVFRSFLSCLKQLNFFCGDVEDFIHIPVDCWGSCSCRNIFSSSYREISKKLFTHWASLWQAESIFLCSCSPL